MPKTILLTRPHRQSEEFAQRLRQECGHEVSCIISPLLVIESVQAPLNIDRYQAVLFTSPNGAKTLKGDFGIIPKCPCICVGDQTAEMARSFGCEAYSAKGSSEELVILVQSVLDPAMGPLLHARGETAAGNIAQRLTEAGFDVDEQIIYRQSPANLNDLASEALSARNVDIVPVFSPMTATIFAQQIQDHPSWDLSGLHVIGLSKNVVAPLQGITFKSVETTGAPTADAMITALKRRVFT